MNDAYQPSYKQISNNTILQYEKERNIDLKEFINGCEMEVPMFFRNLKVLKMDTHKKQD